MDYTNVKFPGYDTAPVTQNVTTGDLLGKGYKGLLYVSLQLHRNLQLNKKKKHLETAFFKVPQVILICSHN